MPSEDDLKKANESFLASYDLVVQIARSVAPNAELAADVVQQAYVEFIRGVGQGKWDLNRDTAPLLNRITRLIGLRTWQERRKSGPDNIKKLEEFLQRKFEQQRDGSDEWVLREERISQVNRCLQKLPDKSRELIDMRYTLEMPIAEIAATIRVSPKNTQQIIRRIRERIRRCVEKILQANDDVPS